MSTTHTPGPWKIHEESTPEWALITPMRGGSIIANVNSETGPDAQSAPATRKMPMMSNARLIAAAPELLDALENAQKQFDSIVSALAQGHTVSISSVQNCAAQCRASIASSSTLK